MSAFKEVKDLTQDNLEQQKNCDSLEVFINRRFGILNGSIQNARAGRSGYSLYLKQDRAIRRGSGSL